MQTTFLIDETKSISGFNGLENKQILLNIMRDIGLFDDINETYITFIKNDLDDKINAINQHKNSTDTTVKLNKRVITEMMTEINKYKNNASKTDPSKTDPSKTDPSKTDPSKTDPITSIKKQTLFKIDENNVTSGDESFITSLDIRSHKLESFEKDVTRTKEDFNKFNKKKLPNNIEFTIDVNDKPNQSEMINLYNKALLLRDQDLNVEIPEDSKKNGTKWINRELNTSSDLENIQKLQNKYIKISKEDAKLDNVIIQKQKVEPRLQEQRLQEPKSIQPIVKEPVVKEPRLQEDFNKKKVSFDDNFLLKMKEKYVKNEDGLDIIEEIINIKSQLQIIIENQNQILSMLKN